MFKRQQVSVGQNEDFLTKLAPFYLFSGECEYPIRKFSPLGIKTSLLVIKPSNSLEKSISSPCQGMIKLC